MIYLDRDANNTADLDQIKARQIVGKVVYWVPFVGYFAAFTKTPTGLILLIVIPSTIIIYSEILKIKEEVIKLAKKRRGNDQA